MKNSQQKGFVGLPILIAILVGIVVVGGGAYLVVHNNKLEQKLDSGSQNVPVTTDNNQNTVVSPSNNQSVFVGTKKTFLPEKIVSIDTSKKTFVVNYESRQAPFTIPTEFSVVSQTTIKKENNLLNFNNLVVNDVVWIRAYEKGKDKYVAKNVIITNDWRSSQVIIKKIEASQNKITAEVFLPPQRRGEQTTLTIIPETEIRKGKAEEGENRKVVGLNNLATGDIASVVEVGFGVHPADDKGPFYTTEIDVVSPYYCEQYLKPTGCIEKDQSVNQTQTKTYTNTQYAFSVSYPQDWKTPTEYADPYLEWSISNSSDTDSFRIQGLPAEKNYTLNKFTSGAWFHGSSDPFTNISIGGVPAVRYDLVFPQYGRGESSQPLGYTRTIQYGVITPNGSILTIYYGGKSFKTKEEAQAVDMSKADQFLSWIKF